MKDFKNKTIWITGASEGIGEELAIQMAKKGARIILSARSVEKLNAVKGTLEGNRHIVYPMDLLKINSIPRAVKQVLAIVGSIDVLVNNAGVSQRSLAMETEIEVERKIMELNHFAVVALSKSVVPKMIERKKGLIITISSIAGKMGVPMRTAYCASKHAVIGYMDALRAELHADNIKVMVIAPSAVQTNISINALEADGKKHNNIDPLIENGISVAKCVEKIIKGIKNETPELLIVKRKEKLAVYTRCFYPALLFKMIMRFKTT